MRPEDLLGMETLDRLAAEQEALIQESVMPCEMFSPGEGHWVLPPGYRAIVNPGSVGQPRVTATPARPSWSMTPSAAASFIAWTIHWSKRSAKSGVRVCRRAWRCA
jgi:hypothetical protein